MDVFDDLIDRSRASPRHIVLAEGEDERIAAGAARAVADGIATVTLLGRKDAVGSVLAAAGAGSEIRIVDPQQSPDAQRYGEAYYELRKHKGIDRRKAMEAVAHPLCFADMMVHMGDAAGSVAGAVFTTPDVVRSALQIIGTDKRYAMVSSFFIMLMCEDHHDFRGGMVFADCGLVVDPNEDELAHIAEAAADNARALLRLEPRIAMLSFSTRRSANHHHVDKVENAAAKLKARRPDLMIEGGLQFDAGIVPEIAAKKAPGSDVAGQANVFVFPDLNSGNIGYKIAERIGRAKALGPILQGLARPANDLSRGCSADDVYRMIAITVAQAQACDG